MATSMRGGGGSWVRGSGAWSRGAGSPADNRPLNPQTTRKVLQTFGPYKAQVAGIALAVLVSAGTGVFPPILLKSIINRGLLAHDLAVVTRYSVFTVAATVASTAFSLLYSYSSMILGQRIMRDLRNRLYDHLQGMSLQFFTNTRTGEVQSRLVNDVAGVQSVVTDTVATLLNNVATVVSSLVVMLYLSRPLTILSVAMIPVFAVLAAQIGRYARGVRRTVQAQLADLNSTMQETLSVSGMLLTKTSGRRQLALKRFAKENESLTESQIKSGMIMRYFFNLIGLTFSITPALVYWLAGYLTISHGDKALSIGTIVAFTMAQSRLFFPLTGLINVQVDLISSMALFDRIFEYLDMRQDIVDAPDAVALQPENVRGDVAFRHVSFRYRDPQLPPALARAETSDSPVGANGSTADRGNLPATLDDISFDAPSGSLVALVGPSGAGKTTLTYLIPRLYDVDSGAVTIDGIDVRRISLDSIGKIIGVVTQETYLVHDTIRENLRYGRPDATDEELAAAAKSAAIHDHIASLPDGYDTIVGERGYKLSGGEKQRIAIARAILKDPRILILDEATSALDTQNERLIQAALTPLMAGRTTFVIAHRLSTILAADLILVFQGGRVVERGTHISLLAENGLYARLYDAQLKGGKEPDEPVGNLIR